jgi:RNA polymerase sigma-70 factor, ECF subfamily
MAFAIDTDPIKARSGGPMVGALDNRIGLGRGFGESVSVSGAWRQDVAAGFVEDLFAAHHGEIYAYLIRMLRDPELAADLTQDAFIKAYRNYDSLEKPENARAWLYQIAHRVALDHIRRQKIVRFMPWTGESHGAAPSTERLVMDAHLSGDLQRALARIPERQRAALLLAELHDLTGLELAAALGVSHVAARALLTRARESLRQALATEREAEAVAEANTEAATTEKDPARADRNRRSGAAR